MPQLLPRPPQASAAHADHIAVPSKSFSTPGEQSKAAPTRERADGPISLRGPSASPLSKSAVAGQCSKVIALAACTSRAGSSKSTNRCLHSRSPPPLALPARQQHSLRRYAAVAARRRSRHHAAAAAAAAARLSFPPCTPLHAPYPAAARSPCSGNSLAPWLTRTAFPPALRHSPVPPPPPAAARRRPPTPSDQHPAPWCWDSGRHATRLGTGPTPARRERAGHHR